MTEKQIVTRIRQIMYDRKISGTESNAVELNRLKAELKALRDQKDITEGFSNDMSTEDMIAYLRQHHDTNLHQDYLNHINTFSKFVLQNVPVNSIQTDLPKLDREKVEQYKQMDFSKAPPIVMGGGYILDGYHRANVAKALGLPTIKAYVGVQGQQGVAEGVPQPGKSSGKPISWIDPTKVVTEYLTLDEIFKSVSDIPYYYNNVVTDRDNKDFTWGVTKRVIQYAKELVIRPDAYKNWPPIIVLDGKLQDGAHRISTIYLMQQRVQPNNPIWKNAKLKVEFGTPDNVKQDVAEEWSKKYKSSINCSHPNGFSQRAHCAGKKKHLGEMSEDLLNELFDANSVYPVEVKQISFRDTEVSATTQDGRKITCVMRYDPRIQIKIISIDFDVDGQVTLTGQGDATKILATVVEAVKKQVAQIEPEFLIFLADSQHQRIYSAMTRRLGGNYQRMRYQDTPAIFKYYTQGMDPNTVFILHNTAVDEVMEMTCPDCGMCQTHGRLDEIKKGQKDSNGNTKCWPGKHAEGTKKGKNGGQVRNCVSNESVAEGTSENAWNAGMSDEDFIRKFGKLEFDRLTKEYGISSIPVPDLIGYRAKEPTDPRVRLHRGLDGMGAKLKSFIKQQGVAEGLENNNTTAQKIFFARSNVAPNGWSYDHVGFITPDGKQIQMSGHKGNDVYVTNDVTDDPKFPKQNIKIVSLSKPVSVPTINSVGAENCGTFVANVLQANGIKSIDTQRIYSVFKQPQKQSVAKGTKNIKGAQKMREDTEDSTAVTHRGGIVNRTGGVTRHQKGPGVYGGFEPESDPSTELSKNFVNKHDSSMGVIWPKEKRFQGGIDVDGNMLSRVKKIKRSQKMREDTEAEGATVKNSLHTIIRVATHLERQMGEDEDFPEWVSEKIGSVKDQIVSVMDYEISDKEMQGMAENSLNEEWSYASDKKYTKLDPYKRYNIYVGKKKFNNLYFIAVAENPRTLDAKYKAKGETSDQAVDKLKLEIDKEIDTAVKVSGRAAIDFNVNFVKEVLESSTDTFYAKIISGPRLVLAGPEMMEYPEIMHDEGFKSSSIRTIKVGEGATKLPAVPLSASAAQASGVIANGRYVLGSETIDKDGNRVFDLIFDSVVENPRDHVRLKEPAITIGTDRAQNMKEGTALDNMFGGSMQQLGNLGIRKNRDVSEGKWDIDRRTLRMHPNNDDPDQRHGLYIDGRLVKTYNSRDEAENVKRSDERFSDAEIKKITEANRNQDRNWEDEAEQEMAPDKNSPYYVFWTGQSHEWYGDGNPESGYGRYKPKGEAGGIVAINIKDRDTAEKIADSLNAQAENGTFFEKAIYNKWNEDYYLVDYMGAEARSMKKIDEYEQRMLDYDLKSGKVKDYANQGIMEGQLNEFVAALLPEIVAGARIALPYLGRILGSMGRGAGNVIGKTATGVGRGVADVAKAGVNATAQNAGKVGLGVGAAELGIEAGKGANNAISDIGHATSEVMQSVPKQVASGLEQVYTDTKSAAGVLTQILGKALDGITIGKIAKYAVEYAVPLVTVIAILYGGKKLIDKVLSEQDMAEGGMGGINRCAPSNDVSYEKVLDEVRQKWKSNKNNMLESKITSAVDYIMSEDAPCWKNYKQGI